MSYDPCVDDYIKWRGHEGWVYFKCDEYITIEIGVKRKECNLSNHIHKMNHILLVCQKYYWDEIVYLRSRTSIHDQ